MSDHASHPRPHCTRRARPSLPFHTVCPWRGRAVLKSTCHYRQVGIFPSLQSSGKPNIYPRSTAHSPASPTSSPAPRQPGGRAMLGRKASKRVRRVSSLINARTPKHRLFAPRPTHLTFTAGSCEPKEAARRAQAALAGPGGGDGGRGRRGGGRRSAVPGCGETTAAAGLAAAAGVSGARDERRVLPGRWLRPRPRTCCCCHRRRAPAPPCVGASPQRVRTAGPRVGRSG